jgi:uncharacterized protein (TIGR03067 family)
MNWFAAVGLAVVLTAPGPKDPPKKARPSVIGQWSCESIAFGGAVSPNPGMTFEFTADGRVRQHKAGLGVIRDIEFKTDPAKDPAEFEWNLGNGAPTCLGIYKVEGDTLTLCYWDGPDGKRPDKFEAGAGTKLTIITLKRVEKKKE